MKDVTDKNFGFIIAFWLPGFLLLWGLSYSLADVQVWFASAQDDKMPTVGGFLYVTFASLALGLLISAVRFVSVDQAFYLFLGRPNIVYGNLKEEHTLAAFQTAIENQYRYYQYYSHSFIAIAGATAFYVLQTGHTPTPLILYLLCGACIILLIAAGNELRRFNDRAGDITTNPPTPTKDPIKIEILPAALRLEGGIKTENTTNAGLKLDGSVEVKLKTN